jgi:hypothetical protein
MKKKRKKENRDVLSEIIYEKSRKIKLNENWVKRKVSKTQEHKWN